MRKTGSILLFVLCLLVGPGAGASANEKGLTQYVDQWIGTGGHGHTFLGANVPFGLVQLGPTEPSRGWDWCSGYAYRDSVLLGFSHTHLSGTGIGDLGDITFLPVSSQDEDSTTFSHSDETVRPGYYAINLHDPRVKVELTATERVGFHRYTWAGNGSGLLKINFNKGIQWDQLTQCSLQPQGSHALSGARISTGWAKNQQVYFYADFSTDVEVVSEKENVFTVRLKDVSKPVLIKVGISAVSPDNARMNLQAEVPDWNFDEVAARANDKWEHHLGRVRIKTNDDAARRIFYTAMYHLAIAPSIFSDVNGDYRGSDYQVHHGDFTNYTTFSLWDTYRAAMPLMTLMYPEKMGDIAQTFIHIFKEQGKLPVWHLWGNETDCMVGNPGVIVLADLTLKGFVEDKEDAFQAMKASEMRDERGLKEMKEYGYIPYDKGEKAETAAKTLEFAIADAGVAKVARMLGHDDDYRYFRERAQAYRHIFDPKDCFLKGTDSKGNFRTDFDPFYSYHEVSDFTEGNAWQYNWLVPHDVHGLVGLFPSEESFVRKLDSLFIVHGDMGANASMDITGLIGQYAHGNEPSHQVLFMYNYVGKPWKGARLMRQTYEEMYKDEPDGLCGNEDVGQMSAWYIIATMGLYQVEPEGGKFVIGSPLWDEAELSVGGSKTFKIVAKNNSKENMYVQAARLNGKRYTKSYIDYNTIMQGGTLELTMGPKPSKWGTAKKDRP